MLDQTVRYRRPLIVAAHLCLFAFSYAMAFALRFDFALPENQLRLFLTTLPIVVVLRAGAFAAFRLYEGLWRYVSVRDVVEMAKAVTLSSALFTMGALLLGFRGLPRSVLLLDWVLCVGVAGGLRIAARALLERRTAPAGELAGEVAERRRALIVGAGDVAEALLREIGRGALPYSVLGIVTDDPALRGRSLRGVSVLGAVDDIPALCSRYDIAEVLIAAVNGSAGDRRRVALRCREAKVKVRSVPALPEILQGRAGVAQLRLVNDEELLGRSAIGTNVGRLREELTGGRVLVTGAAGSIGSELARQIASFDPEVLVLFDRGESDLYVTYVELRERFPHTTIEAVVGDILDVARVQQVMDDYSPQLVYHAAAYKHVPLMEAHPIEAIKNNVLGTEIVARAAIDARVSEFVLISTDKAVRPVGIMGMTKRAAEFVIRSLAGRGTTFVAVRFGNVLGSNGSVLPLFQKQIASGYPVTVTDPDALRYFMLTSEAVELVLTAGALGRDGEVYVLHTGEPVRIGDLAENYIRLAGFEPDLEVPIRVTGLRPGERLREELWVDDEMVVPGPDEKIKVVREPAFAEQEFRRSLDILRTLVDEGMKESAVQMLRSLVVAHESPAPTAADVVG